MVASTGYITRKEILSVLDDNFNFRSSTNEFDKIKYYRVEANGPALEISKQLDNSVIAKFQVERNIEPDKISERLIATKEDLFDCIRFFKKTVAVIESNGLEDIYPKADSKLNFSLNSILYGPPGTGKTYKTAELAVQICDGEASKSRKDVVTRYEELRRDGRINFTTFHQAYGYEDFIEGLRPESVDGQISYPVRPGVFRRICDACRRSGIVKSGLTGKPLNERKIYKMSLGPVGTSDGIRTFKECIDNGYILLGWGSHVDFTDCNTASAIRDKFRNDYPNGENPDSQVRYAEIFKNELKVGDIVIVSRGNKAFQAIAEVTGDYEYLEEAASEHYHQMRPVKWLAVFENSHNVNEIFREIFLNQHFIT